MRAGVFGRADTLLFALFVVDMLFLPMFHVGPIPVKPFYLFLPLCVVYAVRPGEPSLTAALCWALAAVCVIGGLFLRVIEPDAALGETLRNSLIWVLAPLAFAFGWVNRARRLDFLVWMLLAYVALTAVVSFGYRDLPWLVNFYGLDPWVRAGLFEVRSPGIHFNANLSALAGNLMFLGVVIGERYGRIVFRSVVHRWMLFAPLVGLHLMLGGRGEMLAALILGGIWMRYVAGARDTGRQILYWGIATALVIAVLGASFGILTSRTTRFEWVKSQFTSSITFITYENLVNPASRINSVVLRPFVKGERVWTRFRYSPIWGSGFDTGQTYPFEETYFHNDWAVILVAGGLVGFGLFVTVVRRAALVSGAMLVPFFLSAPVNTFILAPQHVMFYFAIAGYFAHARACERETGAEVSKSVRD